LALACIFNALESQSKQQHRRQATTKGKDKYLELLDDLSQLFFVALGTSKNLNMDAVFDTQDVLDEIIREHNQTSRMKREQEEEQQKEEDDQQKDDEKEACDNRDDDHSVDASVQSHSDDDEEDDDNNNDDNDSCSETPTLSSSSSSSSSLSSSKHTHDTSSKTSTFDVSPTSVICNSSCHTAASVSTRDSADNNAGEAA
jgi:hypothetical protein